MFFRIRRDDWGFGVTNNVGEVGVRDGASNSGNVRRKIVDTRRVNTKICARGVGHLIWFGGWSVIFVEILDGDLIFCRSIIVSDRIVIISDAAGTIE